MPRTDSTAWSREAGREVDAEVLAHISPARSSARQESAGCLGGGLGLGSADHVRDAQPLVRHDRNSVTDACCYSPDVVLGDRGNDHDKYRRLIWGLGVKPLIARRGIEHGSGLGTQRWVVERAFAHLHWFRRPRIRWEIRDDIHEAFLTLGCALICRRRLRSRC
ncbi:hypothetical protein GCM10011579_092380 [Streptomyces albiflavescens]|uniref:Transposase IS4-like domain-containing protein n=1 Tax=Streptomyces albiflavescens TaxID=1623582 RepID=A0A918DAI4_9ACTN|nr:hypothetical protein GCM10011579_092380 [Streptomyces albiflavescens]